MVDEEEQTFRTSNTNQFPQPKSVTAPALYVDCGEPPRLEVVDVVFRFGSARAPGNTMSRSLTELEATPLFDVARYPSAGASSQMLT